MQLYERTYEPIILIGLDMNTLNINEKGIYNRIQANDETYINKQYLDIVETNNLEIDGIKFQFTDMIWDFSDKKQEGKLIQITFINLIQLVI